MKAIFVLCVALALAGCGTTKALVKGVDNPVTAEDMYKVEQGAIVVASALNTYRTACVRKQIDQRCRDVIVQIQSYTRPAAAMLPRLRAYVRNNDRINAVNAYNTIIGLMADARNVAVANGVAIQ